MYNRPNVIEKPNKYSFTFCIFGTSIKVYFINFIKSSKKAHYLRWAELISYQVLNIDYCMIYGLT